MMFNNDVTRRFGETETPFYYYDLSLLERTVSAVRSAAGDYHVHYALKANAHPEILSIIKKGGLGADCVSGNEVKRALECGFSPGQIAFAGVGKSDREIKLALEAGIFSFNVESIPELEVIAGFAKAANKTANIALRINPNVDAHTHKYITTGLEENKFGINPYEFDAVISKVAALPQLKLIGVHFHIGSQIQDLSAFGQLCVKSNEITRWFHNKGFALEHINVGGGLGVNYQDPDKENIVDFDAFFGTFRKFLEPPGKQEVHFELGRSIVAQCGSLISRVLYVKNAINTDFLILDAGMTELIRPALYQAYHKIENISRPDAPVKKYDVVGPICESSDCFGKAVMMQESGRGDLIAIRSAGAYGAVMSSRYNLREEVQSIFHPAV